MSLHAAHRHASGYNAAHLNKHGLKAAVVMAAVGAALSVMAVTSTAQADTAASTNASMSLSTESCATALPALQQSAYSEQSGHLQALKALVACDTRLGQVEQANFAAWLIDRDLDRADPHDD
jgi:flagellar motility protein MotE (MotC chaperone)